MTNATNDIDLDLNKLEALAQEAKKWDLAIVQRLNPSSVLALIDLARRATAPQAATTEQAGAAASHKMMPTEVTPEIARAIRAAFQDARATPATIYAAVLNAATTASASAQPAAPVVDGELPKSNDGKEQDAFEAWASGQKYDMTTHPLHWLFLNERTYAARQGWKAALEYVGSVAAARSAPVGEGRTCGWIQFIDGVQTQNFARNEDELEDVKKIFRLMRHTGKAEYVPVYFASPSHPEPAGGKEQA